MDEYLLDIILISVFAMFCLYFSLERDTFKVIPPYMPKACIKKELNISKLIDEIDDTTTSNDRAIFVEANYHADYFDIMRFFHWLSDNNVVFNDENMEVASVSPNTDLAYVNTLRKQLNGMSKYNYDEIVKTWGYKKQFAKRNFPWERQLEDLGLPSNLYKEFASPSPVNVIVRKIEQNETNKQIQYVIEAVIRKISSPVNLVVKLTFVQQKGAPNTEFETVYILGYEK